MDECYSVTQANKLAKQVLEEYSLWIQGEVSEVSANRSYYKFFSIKDDDSILSCTYPVRDLPKLNFEIENGIQIKAFGKLSVYEPWGKFQFKVEILEKAGMGDLQARIEEIKSRLQKEGLFDESKKRKLPPIPKRIAVVTSKDGAAWKDFLKIITQRYPNIEILLYDVLVQGDKAATSIIKALKYLNTLDDIDLIVITRGGGSLEDLMAFNDEALARAVAASKYPTVSAVGHEKDISIVDLVADLRASTPSNAAELISPDKETLYQLLDTRESKLETWIKNKFNNSYLELRSTIDRSMITDEYRLLRRFREELSNIATKIVSHKRIYDSYYSSLEQFKYKLSQSLITKISDLKVKEENIYESIRIGSNKILLSNNNLLENLGLKLKLNDPLQILDKGYSIVKDSKGKVIKSISEISKGEIITTKISDGEFNSSILSITKK